MTVIDSIKKGFRKLEPLERGYLIAIIFLALFVPFIEYYAISNINQEIDNYENQIESIGSTIDYGMYIDMLSEIPRVVGYSLNMSASSAIHSRLEVRYVQQCNNLNSASNYTNITIDCSKLSTVEILRDDVEYKRLKDTRKLVYGAREDLKKKVLELKSEKEDLITWRNSAYLALVFLSGMGSIFKYAIEKNNSKR